MVDGCTITHALYAIQRKCECTIFFCAVLDPNIVQRNMANKKRRFHIRIVARQMFEQQARVQLLLLRDENESHTHNLIIAYEATLYVYSTQLTALFSATRNEYILQFFFVLMLSALYEAYITPLRCILEFMSPLVQVHFFAI